MLEIDIEKRIVNGSWEGYIGRVNRQSIRVFTGKRMSGVELTNFFASGSLDNTKLKVYGPDGPIYLTYEAIDISSPGSVAAHSPRVFIEERTLERFIDNFDQYVEGSSGVAKAAAQEALDAKEELTTDVSQAIEELDEVKAANRKRYLDPVATVAERDSNYPTPEHGDSVWVSGEGRMYRYEDPAVDPSVTVAAWKVTNENDPSAIDMVNQQLADKVGGERKARLEDLSPDVLGAIEGGEGTSFNLLSIPQDKSVTPEKTTFFKKSTINLFNPYTIKEKTQIDTETDGREKNFNNVFGDYNASDFIPVQPGAQYVLNVRIRSVVFFDSAKVFIGSYYEPGYLPERILAGAPFTVPSDAEFVRLNLRFDTDVGIIQLNQGATVLPFEPHFIPPSYIAPKSISKSELEDEVLNDFATKTEVMQVEEKLSRNEIGIIPNDFKRWKLLDDSTDASKWSYDSTNSTAVGTVSGVSEIDNSKFRANTKIPSNTLKPWMFSDNGAMSGLSEVFDNKMLKFEATTNGHAFFHRPLPEREDFSKSGEIAFAVWIDSVSTDTDDGANIQPIAYHNYPSELTKFHRAMDAYPTMSNGKGTWMIVSVPSIRKQSSPVIWMQAGSSPYGIQTLSTVDGIGFRVTNNKTDGKIARIYVSGIFRIDNNLDKGKLILTFDDGFQSQYSEGFKYMYDTYGYKASIAMVGAWVEAGQMGQFPELPAMTKGQMLEVQDAGWDIVSHTWSHVNLGYDGYSPSFLYNEVQKNHQWLRDNGITKGSRFLMYPEGSWNKNTLEVVKQFHSMARTTTPIYMQINPTTKQYSYPSIDSAALTETAWRDLLQTLQDHKTIASRHFHHIGTGGWNPISIEKFRLFIDIIKEYDVDVITWSELYDDIIMKS